MAAQGLDGTTTAALRVINTRTVLDALRLDPGPQTLSMLAETTGLTRPTVNGSLCELASIGLVRDVPPKLSRMGRPARRFQFAADAAIAAGIDLRPDRVRIQVVDLLGRSLARSFRPQLQIAKPEAAVMASVEQLEGTLRQAGLVNDALMAVSIAVPGVVSPEGVLWKSVVVPQWVDADLPGMLGSVLSSHPAVSVDNAANHAASSELSFRPADDRQQRPKSFLFVLVDEGIGAGMVLNDEVLRGARGCAAEVGALDSLRWSSASARLMAATAAPDLSLLTHFTRSRGAEREALVEFASDVATGTAALVLAYDPEVVIIGGVLAMAEAEYLDLIREELAASCIYPPRVVRARFGEDAVARGAGLRALRMVEQQLFP